MRTPPPEERRFRPKFWPVVITIPTFFVLVGLGVWQMNRLAWKTEIVAYREAQLSVPAVALTD